MLRLIKSKIRADTNLKDLLWNSGVLYIGGFITILFTFTQQITTANFLGASEYGRFATVLSSSTLLLLFIDVRTWELATKLLAPAILQQDNLEITRVTSWLILVDLVLGCLGAFLLFLLAEPLAIYLLKQPNLANLVRLYGLGIPFRMIAAGAPYALTRLYNRFGLLTGKSIAFAVVRLVTISGAAWMGLGLAGVIIAAMLCELFNMLAQLIMLVVMYQRYMPGTPFVDLTRPKVYKEGRKMIRGMWIFATLKGLQMETFIPITALLTSPAQVGLLRSGFDVADLITKLITPLSVVIFPTVIKTYDQGRDEFLQLLKQITVILVVMSVPLCLSIALLFPYLLPLFMGRDYAGIAPVATLLALGFTVNAILIWTRPAIVAIGGLIVQQNIVSFVLMIFSTIALLILVPAYGAVGSAFVAGSLFALFNLISFGLFWFRFKNKHR